MEQYDRTPRGLKSSNAGDRKPRHFPKLLIVNERFPDLAGPHQKYILSHKGRKDPNGIGQQMWKNGILSVIWYHDDWKKHVKPSRLKK